MIASSFPLLDVFLSIAMFFIIFYWLFLAITIVVDIFRSHDISGLSKALWLLFVLILPLLGVLIYLIARGGSMQDRQVAQMRSDKNAFDSYVRQAAGSGSTADELAKIADLKAKGSISDAEFEAAKAKILS
ncbi:MAG: SHOCT domain-containing protein [Actinomycetota bacterium]